MIMLLLVLLFIIVGDFIDAIPAIIIFMPIITDLTKNADINPVHMGVVIIVTLAFGLITPPYGLCLLMASKFVGVSFPRRWWRRCRSISSFSRPSPSASFSRNRAVAAEDLLPQSVGCFHNPNGPGYICP